MLTGWLDCPEPSPTQAKNTSSESPVRPTRCPTSRWYAPSLWPWQSVRTSTLHPRIHDNSCRLADSPGSRAYFVILIRLYNRCTALTTFERIVRLVSRRRMSLCVNTLPRCFRTSLARRILRSRTGKLLSTKLRTRLRQRGAFLVVNSVTSIENALSSSRVIEEKTALGNFILVWK